MKDLSNTKYPSVAVLLASFQGVEWIEQQISSISSQKQVSISLLISDDSSSDGTQNWLDENQTLFNYHLLNKSRAGSASKNFFTLLRDTDLTSFDYVALSDQDDIWHNDKLSRAISFLSNSTYSAYSSNVMAVWSDGRKKVINKSQPQTRFDFLFESPGPGCTFVMCKSLALDLQFFIIENSKTLNEIELHDWFIYAFARSRNYQWFIDSYVSMQYRQHFNNAFGVNSGFKALFSRLLKMKNGWYLQQILLTAQALELNHLPPIIMLKRLSLIDRLKLITQCSNYRRKLSDRFALAVFILFFARKE